MDGAPRRSRYSGVSDEAKEMLALGESGRYEFKRDADAIKPGVLAALANWVSLDETLGAAHLLVGVDEQEDRVTGLVRGVPHGLAKGLDRAVSRIQDLASRTHPVPVDVYIIEEATDERAPFLRVEIRPTMPPHFDDEGRRQTRQGRSTRALTDEEMLRIYLDRESGSFAARFRQTSADLRAAVGAVGAQVGQIGDAIEHTIARPISELTQAADSATAAAMGAESTAEAVSYDVSILQDHLRRLEALIEDVHDVSPEALAEQVAHLRRRIWWCFTVDTWERSSARADRLTRDLRRLRVKDVALDGGRNAWEVRTWENLLDERKKQRGERGTLKWWHACTNEVEGFFTKPAYEAPQIPDLRAELRGDLNRALDDPGSLTRRFEALVKART